MQRRNWQQKVWAVICVLVILSMFTWTLAR